jgi:hypothetical protein
MSHMLSRPAHAHPLIVQLLVQTSGAAAHMKHHSSVLGQHADGQAGCCWWALHLRVTYCRPTFSSEGQMRKGSHVATCHGRSSRLVSCVRSRWGMPVLQFVP